MAESTAKRKYESPRQIARQAQILSAARDMLADEGYAKTTIRGLAERANVAPGTLYNLYGGKDALIIAAVDELLQTIRAATEAERRTGYSKNYRPGQTNESCDRG